MLSTNLPRLVIPLSAVLVGLVDFGVAFVVLLGMMAYYGIVPTVACWDIMHQRGYGGESQLHEAWEFGHRLFAKLQAFHRSLQKKA